MITAELITRNRLSERHVRLPHSRLICGAAGFVSRMARAGRASTRPARRGDPARRRLCLFEKRVALELLVWLDFFFFFFGLCVHVGFKETHSVDAAERLSLPVGPVRHYVVRAAPARLSLLIKP